MIVVHTIRLQDGSRIECRTPQGWTLIEADSSEAPIRYPSDVPQIVRRRGGEVVDPLLAIAPDMLAFMLDLEDHCQRGGDGAEGEALRVRAKAILAKAPTRPPVKADGVHPPPPWPIGPADNARRSGWVSFFAGKGREDCPFPPARRDLQDGYREGWDLAERERNGRSVTR